MRAERVDTSKPWEDPTSLDPQISITAPDGFVYANLHKEDDRPGVDYNATLTNVVLPATGVYLISMETTRGSGQYRLSFDFTSVAAPAQQALSLYGGDQTTPLNRAVTTAAVMLDARGYPISGADVLYSVTPVAGDTGTLQFQSPNPAQTGPDGTARMDVKMTGVGKIQFGPAFVSTGLSLLANAPSLESSRAGEAEQQLSIPRYQPVAHRTVVFDGLNDDGSLGISVTGYEAIKAHAPGERGERIEKPGDKAPATPDTNLRGLATPLVQALPDLPANRRAIALSAASCTPAAPYRLAGIPADQEPVTPFTVTLTDLTPKTGQTQPAGEVGDSGIKGHRIEKTIRLKIEIKDGNNQTPNYPVLVKLSVGGARHGTLILDPDGAATECNEAVFLWHESPTKLNEEIKYRLGTLAIYGGVLPDPQSPPNVLPVWATAEVLNLEIATPKPPAGRAPQSSVYDDATTTQLAKSYGVHPEPGQPDRFSCIDYQGNACPDSFKFWIGYLASKSGSNLYGTDPYHDYNVYSLVDRYGNETFGYVVNTTQINQGVTTTFRDQASGSGGGFNQYSIFTSWLLPPQNLTLNVPLTLSYPADPDDWLAGSVTKNITYLFEGGSSTKVLARRRQYDLIDGDGNRGTDDGNFPMSVSPGATEGSMPKNDKGNTNRLALLATSGTILENLWPWYEPTTTGAKTWTQQTSTTWTASPTRNPEVTLETQSQAAFRFTLIDDNQKVVPEASFRVHRCPQVRHSDQEDIATCNLPALDSQAGIVASVTVNEGGSGNARGYLGLELVTAPIAPGPYYVKVESLDGTYRIRKQADFVTKADPISGEGEGAFAICLVEATQILTESFEPLRATLNISLNRTVYLREFDPAEGASDYRADVVLHSDSTGLDTQLQDVVFRRIGGSHLFMTDAISILTPDGSLPGQQGAQYLLSSMSNARIPLAGALAPPSGSYSVWRRRSRSGSPESRSAGDARSRMVTIETATGNFDGVTPGREKIEAGVRWSLAGGYVSMKLLNVNDGEVFSLESYGATRLTTNLSSLGGLSVGPTQQGNLGDLKTFPEPGSTADPFRALVGANQTVNPGLYRVRAKWGKSSQQASSALLGAGCTTDKPAIPVCVDDWIISIGERVVVDREASVTSDLDGFLATIQTPNPPGARWTTAQFLDQVVTRGSQIYQNVGANVVITTNTETLRPRLRVMIRSNMTTSSCGPFIPKLNYGCVPSAPFPLADPDLDAMPAADSGAGISLYHTYNGFSFGYHPAHPGDICCLSDEPLPHTPLQPIRNDNPSTWTEANPSPRDILLNRLSNLVVHESAHGWGLTTPGIYPSHSGAGGALLAIDARAVKPKWIENELSLGVTRGHEPVNEDVGGFGFNRDEAIIDGSTKINPANYWIMQGGFFRFIERNPLQPGQYDDGMYPSWWLLFDRPLRFSLRSDFSARNRPDRSIESFFDDRLPLCLPLNRYCRP